MVAGDVSKMRRLEKRRDAIRRLGKVEHASAKRWTMGIGSDAC